MRDSRAQASREAGFSLIELIVAMAITLVVTGAIYGLIAGGQNAFRREPEMAERQQNIRMAMDLIMRDIANASSGLPTFVQPFTPGLNACAGCPMSPDNINATDEIEMLTNSESRDTEPICRRIGVANDGNVQLIRNLTIGANPLQPNTIVIPFTANGRWTLRNLAATTQTTIPVPATDCTAGFHTDLDMVTAGPTGLNIGATPCAPNGWGNIIAPCELVGLSFANVVRYRIRLDGAGVPMLERWSSDAPGSIAGGIAVPATFQTIARGIENLQVQYLRANGNPNLPADWLDAAPLVVLGDYDSLITQVRVSLAARSEAQNIAGATRVALGPDAIRGTLMSAASPRATLMNLTLPATAPSPAPIRWR